jgi:hypothetical protein
MNLKFVILLFLILINRLLKLKKCYNLYFTSQYAISKIIHYFLIKSYNSYQNLDNYKIN